jgi:choline monooxygenase
VTGPSIEIHPDIRKAATLPAWFYRDSACYDALRERVFASSWQPVLDCSCPREPGDVAPFTLLPGLLDEPLLLVRGEDELRCLSNVCTHRANLVAGTPGRLRELRCRYHGRCFGLDGRMAFMPDFEEAESFPSEDDDLPAAACRTWGGVPFVSLDPSAPFETWIGFLKERVAWLEPETFVFDPDARCDYHVAAHWALYCENYLEGYHIPYVHPALNPATDIQRHPTELFPFGSLRVGMAGPGEPAFEPPAGHPDRGNRLAGYHAFLFPNLMIDLYPWGASIKVARPSGPDRTTVSCYALVRDPHLRGRGAGSDLHTVEMEDESVVEGVQRGMRSRLYRRGRFSPTRERGVHHFHRLLADGVNGSES